MKYMTNEIFYLYDRFINRMNDPDVIAHRNSFNSVYDYVKEFRTLELKLPRQVGKTYFISTMARTGNAIVVVPNASIGSEYKRSGIKFTTIENENYFKGKRIENLFLDEVPIDVMIKKCPYINLKFTFDTTIVSLYT